MIDEYKTLMNMDIPELLEYIQLLPDNKVIIDTETTGLGGSTIQQITQISAIHLNRNNEILDQFDKKILLNDDIKERMKLDVEFPNGINTPSHQSLSPWKTEKILKFNHYEDGDYEYIDENVCILMFDNWLSIKLPCYLVAQNAPFDMEMLNGRIETKLFNKYLKLDTKIIIQLFYIPLLQKLSETQRSYNDVLEQIGKSDRDGGLHSSSMSKIGPSLGIDMSNYHDALTDCNITSQMFNKMLEILEDNKDVDISYYQNQRTEIMLANII